MEQKLSGFILQDNSSWFIVADFDENLSGKKSWIEECKSFIEGCNHYQLSAYLILNAREAARAPMYGYFFNQITRLIKAEK